MAIRVVVVEDSPTQQAALVRLLEDDAGIEIVATAAHVDAAVAAVAAHAPDAVTMDLDVPGGGGVAAIRRIMAEHPAPVLVLSALIAGAAARPAVEALAAGAVDAVPKPPVWDAAHAAELRRTLRRVAGVPVVRRRARPRAAGGRPLVGIAASTGGPAALATLLGGLRDLEAPMLAVQHIHRSFAAALTDFLGRETGVSVRLATDGETPEPGVLLMAPGDHHLVLDGARRVRLRAEPATALHRPSADELLRSIADHAREDAVGVVLTGMGRDGARGLLAVRAVGGATFAQDAASSVVYGMPKAACELGAVETQGPPAALAAGIRHAVRERRP